MADAGSNSVIIIKKRGKSAGHAHHGGAWKVAYADFVTAMMAFFLLMWLLNATTEDQRKGLADYFNPTIPVSKVSGGGQGALNGSSVLSEDTLIRDGVGASADYPQVENMTGADADGAGGEGAERTPTEGEETLEALKGDIDAATADEAVAELASHIQTSLTPEGLLIELIDADDDPLFALGSARPSQLLDDLLYAVAPVLAQVQNKAAIVGHTDALGFSAKRQYSNWELSTDRANAARRMLIKYGFPTEQIAEVAGKADTAPLSTDPSAPQNRRIAILLLNGA